MRARWLQVVGCSLACAILLAGPWVVGASQVGTARAHPPAVEQPDGRAPANGRIPADDLVPVAGVKLAPEAARAFAAMRAAATRDGATIEVTDGYRSFDRQVDLKQRKGWLAARPGTSMHGWGIAVDFDMGVTDFSWLRRHAADFGWVHPPWAQPGGSKPEPWHWEYVGSEAAGAAPTEPELPRRADALVARARFEPADGPVGEWFDIRADMAGVRAGARHYAGTAGPGQPGNFAVAGYRRGADAPMRGLTDLVAGDLVRVRVAGKEDHLYELIDRADLTADDGWALGPDPLDLGPGRTMTLTTASGTGGLTVVWAR